MKDGQSETTRGIECHYTLQRSIHCNHCCFVAANTSLKSVNRDGKTLNNSHSLTLSASAFDSTDLGFESLCGPSMCIHEESLTIQKVLLNGNKEVTKLSSLRGRKMVRVRRQRASRATLHFSWFIDCNETEIGKSSKPKGCLLSSRKIEGSNSSAVVKFNLLVQDPNRGSQMKKIQPHQFDLLQPNKLDWSSTDINFQQRKRLTHWDDSKHCVPFYSSPKSLIAKKKQKWYRPQQAA